MTEKSQPIMSTMDATRGGEVRVSSILHFGRALLRIFVKTVINVVAL